MRAPCLWNVVLESTLDKPPMFPVNYSYPLNAFQSGFSQSCL